MCTARWKVLEAPLTSSHTCQPRASSCGPRSGSGGKFAQQREVGLGLREDRLQAGDKATLFLHPRCHPVGQGSPVVPTWSCVVSGSPSGGAVELAARALATWDRSPCPPPSRARVPPAYSEGDRRAFGRSHGRFLLTQKEMTANRAGRGRCPSQFQTTLLCACPGDPAWEGGPCAAARGSGVGTATPGRARFRRLASPPPRLPLARSRPDTPQRRVPGTAPPGPAPPAAGGVCAPGRPSPDNGSLVPKGVTSQGRRVLFPPRPAPLGGRGGFPGGAVPPPQARRPRACASTGGGRDPASREPSSHRDRPPGDAGTRPRGSAATGLQGVRALHPRRAQVAGSDATARGPGPRAEPAVPESGRGDGGPRGGGESAAQAAASDPKLRGRARERGSRGSRGLAGEPPCQTVEGGEKTSSPGAPLWRPGGRGRSRQAAVAREKATRRLGVDGRPRGVGTRRLDEAGETLDFLGPC